MMWTTEQSMTTKRGNLAAVVGRDGRIYALGGFFVVPPQATLLALACCLIWFRRYLRLTGLR